MPHIRTCLQDLETFSLGLVRLDHSDDPLTARLRHRGEAERSEHSSPMFFSLLVFKQCCGSGSAQIRIKLKGRIRIRIRIRINVISCIRSTSASKRVFSHFMPALSLYVQYTRLYSREHHY